MVTAAASSSVLAVVIVSAAAVASLLFVQCASAQPTPKCQCDPAGYGFCDMFAAQYITFDCSTNETNFQCAQDINDALENYSNPNCSCLDRCVQMPPRGVPIKCESNPWFHKCNRAGCSEDDDNLDRCSFYCAEFFVRNNSILCGVWNGTRYSVCEKECVAHFMKDRDNLDAVGFADCMYDCAH